VCVCVDHPNGQDFSNTHYTVCVSGCLDTVTGDNKRE